MPLPYRRVSRHVEEGSAAYLDAVWLTAAHSFYGGLLVIDPLGRPIEFVHNLLVAPTGFLWPQEQVAELGAASLAHSLFDACVREPDLLVCPASLGSAEWCRDTLAPAIPCARVGAQGEWEWANDPPPATLRAFRVAEELAGRKLALEPFERLRAGLREVYPSAPWGEA